MTIGAVKDHQARGGEHTAWNATHSATWVHRCLRRARRRPARVSLIFFRRWYFTTESRRNVCYLKDGLHEATTPPNQGGNKRPTEVIGDFTSSFRSGPLSAGKRERQRSGKREHLPRDGQRSGVDQRRERGAHALLAHLHLPLVHFDRPHLEERQRPHREHGLLPAPSFGEHVARWPHGFTASYPVRTVFHGSGMSRTTASATAARRTSHPMATGVPID